MNRQNMITLASWSEHRSEILLTTFDSTFTSVSYNLKHTSIEFDNLYAADFNNDGLPDLMLVNRQEKLVVFVLDLKPDSLRVTSAIKVPFEPEQILIGDCNNDKRLDVLVYAHKIPGFFPLIGNGKGRFSPRKIIAPDNAVGAAEFTQVNDDNLLDLILWDWVKSELHILYGVGRGRFIDQSVFPVQGEVEAIVATSMVRSHPLDLILKMTKPSEFQVWEGNDFGDFQLKNRIPFEGYVTDFDFADVNNDDLNDLIVTFDPPSLEVILNNEVDAFSDRIVYASGDYPQKVIVPLQNEENLHDCIVFDRSGGEFIVYRNVMKSSTMADSIQLVTGVSPMEIITNDFNRDGVSDIALINTKGKSVSLYYGQRTVAPSGPFSYSLTDEPSHLAFHSSTDTTLKLVLSFPQSRQISYFTLDAANNSVSHAFIGNEGNAQLIQATMNYQNRAEFVTFNTIMPEGSSLSFYEQLGSITFIERTFRLSPPDFLLGASVTDLNNDRFSDIVYAYRPGDTSMVELGVAFGDSSYSMKHRIVSREIALPEVKRVFINMVDFDRDSVLDLLMQAGPPVEYLLVAKGEGDGLFSDPKIIASGLPVEERSDIHIIDVDRDSLADIVIGSQRLGQVLWFRNRGECNFDSVRVLLTEPGLSHYVIADLDADGVDDVAMTLSKKGVLKIINGKQLSVHR